MPWPPTGVLPLDSTEGPLDANLVCSTLRIYMGAGIASLGQVHLAQNPSNGSDQDQLNITAKHNICQTHRLNYNYAIPNKAWYTRIRKLETATASVVWNSIPADRRKMRS